MNIVCSFECLLFEGLAGIVHYEWNSAVDDAFDLDSTTGIVTVRRPLDHEIRSDYNLSIRAQDSDPVHPLHSIGMISRCR